ncbi:MAG: NRDE family protein [Polaromonas sp.]|uniref:NRDE family protein n=1 Tax=Polaromonas sp. TaxID=1869339 RepID=UPI003266F8A9
MCLIAFAIGASERWPLVVAANRDEFLDRPTLPLARWQTASGQDILSGRDLRAGGTWMGMTPGGRIAFLTNVRGSRAEAGSRSRGELVTRWLESSDDAAGFAATLENDGEHYAGFNLVLGDVRQNAWAWVTNKPPAAEASGLRVQWLVPGIYGLSNAALDTPWPKTVELKQALFAALKAGSGQTTRDLQTPLWLALGNRQRALPEHLPATGVPLALEEALSSAYVVFPDHAYGTRSSTVLVVTASPADPSQAWNVQLEERTYPDRAAEQLTAQPSFAVSRRFTLEWQRPAPAL